MQKIQNLDENFLEHLLKAYFDKNKQVLINYDILNSAVLLFLGYYKTLDKNQHSFHIGIIEKVFGSDKTVITKSNSQSVLGISYMTFCRYKQQYLSTFKHYITQNIEVVTTLDST